MSSEAAEPLRIVIADDHEIVRTGLRFLLAREEDLEVVAEAASAAEAVSSTVAHQPDLVLIDVTMPDQAGIEAMPKLLEACARTRVLVLSMHEEPGYVRAAFAAGASGYVLKDAAAIELVAALRHVAAGGTYVNPALGARMLGVDAKERAAGEADRLSERERAVLHLLALGHTNEEIAKELSVSVRTAKGHRARIMRKLELGSRADLVRYALDKRLLFEPHALTRAVRSD